MRKQLINPNLENSSTTNQDWLDLTQQAQVELTSEDPAYPIEGALDLEKKAGWRASQAGSQCIRIIFDEPRNVRRIMLLFEEKQQPRTQEFVLRWSSDSGHTYQEIVRQQYNFSLPQTTRELENYYVNLKEVTTIELSIIPDTNQQNVRASLTHFRIG
ncbi:hypothetical protein [Tunicatimonas pelagia]|uniref:hypothetical protein n=1 Tax=Tunicatimonas pelagia TaxID=931531 RepID=UPI002666FE76|nr:hypothetical protein [Tunicatimonas pelagia]WKN43302.1 hypothetical protein P0M28_30115 [Tunicatimonas pelagia]